MSCDGHGNANGLQLSVVEVWETYVDLQICNSEVPNFFKEYLLVVTGSDYHLSRTLPPVNTVFRVPQLSTGQTYVAQLRGLLRGIGEQWAEVELKFCTAGLLQLHAGLVAEDHIELQFQAITTDGLEMAVNGYEVVVTSKEFKVPVEIFHDEVTIHDLDGNILRLPPLKPNCVFFVRARPRGKHGLWGSWSDVLRLVTAHNVQVQLDEVGPSYVVVSAIRLGHSKRCDPELRAADLRIKEFHLRLWEPGRRHRGRKVAANGELTGQWFKYEEQMVDLKAGEKHTICITGLIPNRSYLVRTVYRSSMGCWSKPEYFQFRCAPALVITSALGLGCRCLQLQWVQGDIQAETWDHALLQWDDGSAESFPPPSLNSSQESPIEWTLAHPPANCSTSFHEIRCIDIATGRERVVDVHIDTSVYVLEALLPNTPYALSLRSSFHGSWTPWCRTVIATTLEELQVHIVQRGADFLAVQWGRAPPLPLLFLADSDWDLELAKEQEDILAGTHADGKPCVFIPQCHSQPVAIVTTIPVTANKIYDRIQQVCVDLEQITSHPESQTHGHVLFHKSFAAAGHFTFDHLPPDTEFKVHVRFLEEDLKWKDGTEAYASTLSSMAETIVELVEDLNEDLTTGPKWNVLEGLTLNPQNFTKLLKAKVPTAAPPDIHLVEVGESYVVINWDAVTPSQQTITCASAAGPLRIAEYMAQLTSIGTTSSSSKEIYFRTVAKSSQINHLQPSQAYTLTLKRFQPELQTWGPESIPLNFCTTEPLNVTIHCLQPDGVVVKWCRMVELPGNQPKDDRADLVGYRIKMEDHTAHEVQCVRHEKVDEVLYSIAGLQPNRSYSVCVGPLYRRSIHCVYSDPLCFRYDSVDLQVAFVGEVHVVLKWKQLPQQPKDLLCHHGYPDKIIITARQAPGSTISTVEVDIGCTEYRFTGLTPATSYAISAVAFQQMVPPTCADTCDHVQPTECPALFSYDSLPESVPERYLTTLPPPTLTLISAAEDTLLVQWERLDENAFEDEEDVTFDSTAQSFLEWKVQQRLAKEMPSLVGPHYEIKVVDLGNMAEKVVASAPMPACDGTALNQKVQGLMPSHCYWLQLRRQWRGEWGIWGPPLEVSTLSRIHAQVLQVGEDFVSIEWQRPRTPGSSTSTSHCTASYQLVVHEILPQGARVVEALQRAMQKKLNIFSNTPLQQCEVVGRCHTLTNLSPDTPYVITVTERPLAEEVCRWSRPLLFYTLPGVQLRLVGHGEDYMSVKVDRQPERDVVTTRYANAVRASGLQDDAPVLPELHHQDWVKRYGQAVGAQLIVSDGSSETSNREITIELEDSNPPHFDVLGLINGTVYTLKARMRYVDNRWGPWSPPISHRTLPGIRLHLNSVGENAMDLQWHRPVGSTSGCIVMWQVRLAATKRNRTQVGIADSEYEFPGDQLQCTLTDLQPDTSYCIRIRSCDRHNKWSPWSPGVYCSTLPLLEVTLHHLSDIFVCVQWNRPQCSPVVDINPPKGSILTPAQGYDAGYELYAFAVPSAGPGGNGAPHDVQDCEQDIEGQEKCWTKRLTCDASEKQLLLDGLLPGRRYAVTVRALRYSGSLTSPGPTPGLWGPRMYFQTWEPLKVQATAVGQDYICIGWHTEQAVDCIPHVISPAKVSQYKVNWWPITDASDAASSTAAIITAEDVGEAPQFTIENLQGRHSYVVVVWRIFVDPTTPASSSTAPRTLASCSPETKITTLPRVEATVKVVHTDGAEFWVTLPPFNQSPSDPIYGNLSNWNVSPRTYQVMVDDEMTSDVVVLDVQRRTPYSLTLKGLQPDLVYRVSLREVLEGGPTTWCPLLSFSTLPHAPIPGELEWRCGGQIRFTWGVVLGSAPTEVLMGDQVPKDFVFSVECRYRYSADVDWVREASEDRSAQWQVICTRDQPWLEMAEEHPLPAYLFRVRAARHFLYSTTGEQIPLWGPYSLPFYWQTPAEPLSMSNIRITHLKAQTANVSYDGPLNASVQPQLRYEVFLGVNNPSGQWHWRLLITTAALHIGLRNLHPSTTYRLSCRASSVYGKSAKSPMATFKTLAGTAFQQMVSGDPYAEELGDVPEGKLRGLKPIIGESILPSPHSSKQLLVSSAVGDEQLRTTVASGILPRKKGAKLRPSKSICHTSRPWKNIEVPIVRRPATADPSVPINSWGGSLKCTPATAEPRKSTRSPGPLQPLGPTHVAEMILSSSLPDPLTYLEEPWRSVTSDLSSSLHNGGSPFLNHQSPGSQGHSQGMAARRILSRVAS